MSILKPRNVKKLRLQLPKRKQKLAVCFTKTKKKLL